MPKFKDKEEYEKWKTEQLNKAQENPTIKTPEETKADPLPQKPEKTNYDSQLRFSKKDLSDFVVNYFNKNYPGTKKRITQKLFYGKFIPDQKLKTAHNSFAPYDIHNEKALLLYEGMKEGFILTDEFFYYATESDKGKLFLGELYAIKTTRFPIDLAGFSITLNDNRIRFTTPFLFGKELDILQKFFVKMNLEIFELDIDKPTKVQNDIFNNINTVLIDNENIIFVAWNILDHFYDIWLENVQYEFIVCTNYRLIICSFDWAGQKRQVAYSYDDISSTFIKEAPGEISSWLKVCSIRIGAVQSVIDPGGFKCADVEQIQKIVAEKKQKIFDKKSEDLNLHSVTISDEIMKLKNLFDSGALTQEEFNEAKKKLLDQL